MSSSNEEYEVNIDLCIIIQEIDIDNIGRLYLKRANADIPRPITTESNNNDHDCNDS